MPKPSGFRVLAATDGSKQARAAIATARTFPWPSGMPVRAVVARSAPWRGLHGRALQAAAFLARLKPPWGARVILVCIAEPVIVPSAGLLPGSVRSVLGREAAKVNAERLRQGGRELRAIAPRLKKAGWRVRTQVRLDVPLRGLLEAVRASKAGLVCV